EGGALRVALRLGEQPLLGGTARPARRAWAQDALVLARRTVAAPVRVHGERAAVLCWHGHDARTAAALVERAAAVLGAPVQLALAVERNEAGLEAMVAQPERRLRRLALDLHDGALQDVALIAGELRRLEDDLRPIVVGTDHAEAVRAALQELATLVDALDVDLREVATSVEGPGMLRRPFADAIEAIVRVFRARAPIAASVEVRGDADHITDSQRIAVFRVVQEALSNARKHSRATRVQVVVRVQDDRLTAVIADDGIGFDPGRAFDDAAGRERIGLLGMIERVRLLGGTCDVVSRPGAGTTIRVTLPSYRVPAAEDPLTPP
ncbi:MAG TPA: ATP-binding protein, partial [Solirubrobacteraceae bacterium]|nr:ATP-binding protein [Solirubrobacteraceae bacterium]